MRIRLLQAGSFRTHLGVLRNSSRGEALPFHESIMLINGINSEFGTSLSLIRPHVADAALAQPQFHGFFAGCDCFATGAMVAYSEPGKPLGREISFGSAPRFTVSTAAYHSDRNLAVVAEVWSAVLNCSQEEVAVRAGPAELRAVPISAGCGWGLNYDRWTGIPRGELSVNMPSGGDFRYLWRADGAPYAGPLVRELGEGGKRWRMVGLCSSPSAKFGVVVEIPERDVPVFMEIPQHNVLAHA